MNRIGTILEIRDESEKTLELVKYCEILKAKCRMLDNVMDLNERLQDMNNALIERVGYLEQENTKLNADLIERVEAIKEEIEGIKNNDNDDE